MDKMNNRIKQIIQSENLTAGEFAKQVGIQPGAVSHLISGRNKPSLDVVQKILNAFRNINPDWSLFGAGPMNRGGNDAFPKRSIAEPTLFDDANAAPEDNPIDDTPAEDSTSPELKKTEPFTMVTQKCDSRELKKIIVFYSDGTFEELGR